MPSHVSAVIQTPSEPAVADLWHLSPKQTARLMRWVIAAGVILRLLAVTWPADYHMLNSWRESDYTQIARSFYREGMNIFYPRIDWRDNTPGYVEMEFPAIPWTAACLYKVFGYHEQILRVLSALASIGALFAFRRVAERLLPPVGGLLATALFALNGLVISLAWSIQPESLLLLFVMLAAGAMLRWYNAPSPRRLLTACALLSVAILIKSPAAHLGLLMAMLVLSRLGKRAFMDPYVYLGASIALLPGVAWYMWAHDFYATTGLSMGVSNETHFLNWGVLRHPLLPILGNGYFELRDVFGFLGIILGAGVLLTHAPAKKFLLAWFGSIALFYLIIADTSGDGWAYYYHCISVPPAALLISLGALAIMQRLRNSNMSGLGRKWPVRVVGIVVAATLCLSLARAYFFWSKMAYGPGIPAYTCMQELARLVPPDAHIVARGGVRYDAHGHPVAYNASTPFAWMDRKGVNYATEDFSFGWLERSEQEGERYWIAGPDDLKNPEIRKEADQRFRILGRCGDYSLYDLHAHPAMP